MAEKIRIQIAYALPERYFLQDYAVEPGTTIQSAVISSGILTQFHDIDLRKNQVGIFARPAKLTDVLQDGDRIEIYRPLLADPKEIRRKRAEQQRLEQEAEKVRERELKREQKRLDKASAQPQD